MFPIFYASSKSASREYCEAYLDPSPCSRVLELRDDPFERRTVLVRNPCEVHPSFRKETVYPLAAILPVTEFECVPVPFGQFIGETLDQLDTVLQRQRALKKNTPELPSFSYRFDEVEKECDIVPALEKPLVVCNAPRGLEAECELGSALTDPGFHLASGGVMVKSGVDLDGVEALLIQIEQLGIL